MVSACFQPLDIILFPAVIALPPVLISSFCAFPYISTVLLKFRTDKGRDPDPQSFAEDSELLIQIRDDVLGALGVSSDLLSDDFTRYKASLTVM